MRNVLGLARRYHKSGVEADRVLDGSCDVAVENERGHIFVVQRLNGEVHEFDASGHQVRRFGKRPGRQSQEPEREAEDDASSSFHSPHDIALGRDGELFVADRASGTIRRIDPAGQVTLLVGLEDSAPFYHPYRLAFDGHHALYVLDYSPDTDDGPGSTLVRRFDLKTRQITIVLDRAKAERAQPSLFPDPTSWASSSWKDLAVGPAGRVYLLGEHGDIHTWAPDEGVKLMHVPRRLAPTAFPPEGPVVDARGHPVENSMIRSARPTGRPEQLAVDRYGNVYLSDDVADLVLRLDPEGHLDVIAGTPGRRGNVAGPLPGTLEYPQGLSITPRGDLLITVMYAGVVRIRQPHRVQGLRVPLVERDAGRQAR